jgi:hypothetical protein
MKNGFVAVAVALALAGTGLLAETGQISGTAKDEAKKPFTDYSVQARDTQGQVIGTSPLDSTGAFTLPNLGTAKYLVELVNKSGKVVCTEGPYDLSQQAIKDGVVIDCNKVPAAWWLLGAAAAAGITAGVVSTTGSASR